MTVQLDCTYYAIRTPMDKVRICNWETDEIVGTVYMDGTVKTNNTHLRKGLEHAAEGRITTTETGERTCVRGVGVMTGYTRDPEGEERGPVRVDAWRIVSPGTPSFLNAVHESLPSPLRLLSEEYRSLPNDISFDTEPRDKLEKEVGANIGEMTEEMLAESVFRLV